MNPMRVPNGTRVDFKAIRRSNGQNTRMWGLLTFVANNVEWHGLRLEPEDWKHLFAAKVLSLRIVPNLDNNGFITLGAGTSELDRDTFDDIIFAIEEFCAKAGLEPPPPREAPPERRMVVEPPKRQLEAPTIEHRE